MNRRIIDYISIVIIVIIQVLALLAFTFAIFVRPGFLAIIASIIALATAVITAAILDEIKHRLGI